MTAKKAQSRRTAGKADPVAEPGARWPADAVERRPVAALLPYIRNARTHSDEQVAQIAASIREFGWTFAVLVDEAGTIIAGHGRVLAAQRLGLPEVPVICGEHRVLCGDATVLADVEKVLGGELADMAFTDPPYNVNYANTAKDKRQGKSRPILNDALGEDFGALLYDACVNILTQTKGAVYICMSSSELDRLQKAFREAGGKWSTFIVWAKNTFTLGRSDYQRQYEPILYGWKNGTDHYWCGARDQGDVWFFDKPHKNDLHPTMKPVVLVERAIRNSSKSRDIVLDPFGGSGTTMIAAEQSGRRARLIELDPKYVDVIVRRWQQLAGCAARLAATGQPFPVLSASQVLIRD